MLEQMPCYAWNNGSLIGILRLRAGFALLADVTLR